MLKAKRLIFHHLGKLGLKEWYEKSHQGAPATEMNSFGPKPRIQSSEASIVNYTPRSAHECGCDVDSTSNYRFLYLNDDIDDKFKLLVNEEFELEVDKSSISDQIVILRNMENKISLH